MHMNEEPRKQDFRYSTHVLYINGRFSFSFEVHSAVAYSPASRCKPLHCMIGTVPQGAAL